MNRRQSRLAVTIAFCISPVVLGGVIGCRTPTTPPATVAVPNAEAQAYADANKAIMTEFGTTLKRLAARPIPKRPENATKRERREIFAKELDAITVAARDTLTRLDRLTPPPAMREIHGASRDVVLTFRDTNAAYVAALRRGDKKQADALSDKAETDTGAAFGRLRGVLQAALIREGKTPEEAEALTANVVL